MISFSTLSLSPTRYFSCPLSSSNTTGSVVLFNSPSAILSPVSTFSAEFGAVALTAVPIYCSASCAIIPLVAGKVISSSGFNRKCKYSAAPSVVASVYL